MGRGRFGIRAQIGPHPGAGRRSNMVILQTEHFVLRPDGPGRAFCDRCRRSTQIATTLER